MTRLFPCSPVGCLTPLCHRLEFIVKVAFVDSKLLLLCVNGNEKDFLARPRSYFCSDLNYFHMWTSPLPWGVSEASGTHQVLTEGLDYGCCGETEQGEKMDALWLDL